MDNKKVYAVKMAGDDDYSTIAMRCEYRDTEGFTGLCFLTPPDRGHMIPGAVIQDTRRGFKHQSTGYAPGWWTYEALTVKNFRARHWRLVIGGAEIARSVQSDEELHDWFNREFPA